jgi:hypothetical protein
MFAVTNELMSDLGLKLVDASTDTSLVGTYNVGLVATSASGLSNYQIILDNDGTFPATPLIAVTNAFLRIVTGNASKAYGSANPETFNGVINAVKTDGSAYANLDGLYLVYNCSSTTNSAVGTTYPINSDVVDPESKISNYAIDYANSQLVGTLSVTGAVLTVPVKSISLRPGQARPAVSTYITVTNGITGYVNGEGVSVITTWPTWDSAYTTTAHVGDTFPITNKTAAAAANYTFVYTPGLVTVKANTPPTPHNDTVTVPPTTTGKIDVAKLIANDYSPFGDPLILVSVQSVSANGIPITVDSITKMWIYYNSTLPATSLTPGSIDYFTYTVRDSVGGLGTGTVQVKVSSITSTYVPQNLIKATRDSVTGAITLTYLGITGRNYRVQGSTDLLNWSNLSLFDRNVWPDITAPGAATATVFPCVNGAVIVTDPDAASNGNRFYRAITP